MSSSSDSEKETLLIEKADDYESNKSFFQSIFSGREKKKIELDEKDAGLLIIFLFIGMFSRFFRIQFPRNVVFDEVYFGNFTNFYIKGEYFFDIHPPLAKMILALGAYVQEYRGDIKFEELSKKNEKYPSTNYVSLRSVSAFFAGFCTPLSFILARILGCTRLTSVCVGLMVCSDHVMIVEGRFILTDSILHFFSIIAIISVFANEMVNSPLSLTLEGVCIGLACSCKFTAGGIAIFAFLREFSVCFYSAPLRKRALFFQAYFRCCYITFLILIVMISLTCIHLELLPYEPEDRSDFIPYPIKGSLVNKNESNWTQRMEAKPLVFRAASLLLYQLASNSDRTSKHPYSSKWYHWPLLTGKWVLFWASNERVIACNGNLIMYDIVFVVLIISMVNILLNRKLDSIQGGLVLGYLSCLLPFILVPRETFLYHYVISLIFGILNVGVFLNDLHPKYRGFLTSLVCVLVVFGYFLWAPLSYGLEELDLDFLVWRKCWQ